MRYCQVTEILFILNVNRNLNGIHILILPSTPSQAHAGFSQVEPWYSRSDYPFPTEIRSTLGGDFCYSPGPFLGVEHM
jgi:hypothetical protein